jgi:hypothetical protein
MEAFVLLSVSHHYFHHSREEEKMTSSWWAGGRCGGVDGGIGGISGDSRRSRPARFGFFQSRIGGDGAQQFSSIAMGARSILKIPSFKVAKISYTGAVSFLEMKTVCFT